MEDTNSHIFVEESQLCEKVLNINQTIRFAAIYNENGNRLAGGMRRGVPSFLSEEQSEESVLQELKRWESYQSFSEEIGEPQVSMVKYDKVTLITAIFNQKRLLLVSLDPVADINYIISHIRYLLGKELKYHNRREAI